MPTETIPYFNESQQAAAVQDRSRWHLDVLVNRLKHSRDVTHSIRHHDPSTRPPSREALETILDQLIAALFPRHHSRASLDAETVDYFVGNTLNVALTSLAEEIYSGATFLSDSPMPANAVKAAQELTRDFASRLPEIRGLLVTDLHAAFVGDPAATSFPEILIGYPGMAAIIHHRIASELYTRGATLVARLVATIAHARTGIDIHPAATIGNSFFIDHGTGVVIGETTIIGDRVRVYQAVTLGARHFPLDNDGNVIKGNAARHPIIEDDVTIYAGATVLGRIVVGRGSTIGGNVWLTESVPESSFVTQASLRKNQPA